MKKILIGYLDNTVASGITKYLLNLLSKFEKSEVQIDLLYKGKDEEFEKRITELGYNIYSVHSLKHPIKQLFETIDLCKKNQYDIAYFNVSEAYNFVGILAAKLCKVKKVIIHSHSSSAFGKNCFVRKLHYVLNKISKPLIYYCANAYYACSDNAAKWLLPARLYKTKSYKIIYNAIDFEKFKSNEEIRKAVRKELDIENKLVLGFIGRFSREKNTLFLVDILKSVLNSKDAVLLTVGDGKEYNSFIEYAEKLGVKDKIVSVGKSSSAEKYYQAMDVFLLPSFFEGLPVVAIEAQVCGVPCIISDRVDEQILISDTTKQLSIKDSEKWASEIVKGVAGNSSLNENADNYNLRMSKQYRDILCEEPKEITKLPIFLFYGLVLHYLLNITSYFNGINITIFLSGLFIVPYIINYVVNFKKVVKDRINILFIAWIVDFIVTSIINKNYGGMAFVKETIWLMLMLLVVFGYKKDVDKKILKYDIEHIAFFFVVVLTLINIINIMLLIFNIGTFIKSFFGNPVVFGMSKWNRFYGVYYDPNYASVTSAIGIILAYYFMIKAKYSLGKILFMISMIIQTVFIIFAQSRTAYITLIVAYGLLVIISLFVAKPFNKFNGLKIALVNVIYIVIVISTVLGINKYCLLPSRVNELNNKIQNSALVNREALDGEMESELTKENQQEDWIFRRTDSKDISNRRFDIWNSGLEIFNTSPIIGIGINNVEGYVKEKQLNTYVVNNDFQLFTRFHNVLIDVVVSQGLIGLLIVSIILGILIKHFITYRKEVFNSENSFLICTLLCGVLGISVSAMFLSEIFYVNNSCTFMFWLLLGYVYYLVQNNKEGIIKNEQSRHSNVS